MRYNTAMEAVTLWNRFPVSIEQPASWAFMTPQLREWVNIDASTTIEEGCMLEKRIKESDFPFVWMCYFANVFFFLLICSMLLTLLLSHVTVGQVNCYIKLFPRLTDILWGQIWDKPHASIPQLCGKLTEMSEEICGNLQYVDKTRTSKFFTIYVKCPIPPKYKELNSKVIKKHPSNEFIRKRL